MTTDRAPLPRVRVGPTGWMPLIGVGTWPFDDAAAERVVAEALAAGHRMVDTSELYGNERGVGRAIRSSGIDRRELFVVTKIGRVHHVAGGPLAAASGSLERLGLEYLDLLLVHWPNVDLGRMVETWREVADLTVGGPGAVRAVGTANFTVAHLRRVVAATGSVPAVNQLQLDPRMARVEQRAWHRAHGVVTQAWSPLGGSGAPVLAHPAVRAIADRLGCTPAQAVLRWHLDQGAAPIVRSRDPGRAAEQLAVFDLRLDPAATAALAALDGSAFPVDPDRVRA